MLNDVVFTQVCASFGDDDRTRAVVDGDAGRRHGVDDRLAVARTAPSSGSASATGRRPTRRRGGQPRRAAARSRSIGSAHAHLSVQHGRRAAVRRRDGRGRRVRPARRGLGHRGPRRRPPLRRRQAARPAAPARRRPTARPDHPAEQGRGDRPQLRRPRGRAGQRPAGRAADVPQAQHDRRRSGRPDLLPAADQRPPLRGRAGRRDRPHLPRRPGRSRPPT